MSRRALLVVLVVAVAGCVGGPPATTDATATPSPPKTGLPTTGPTTTPPTTQPSYLSPAVDCPGVEWVSFYAFSEHSRRDFWEPDTARIGYTIAGGTTVFFVAYVDGEVAGVEKTQFESGGSVTSDGSKVVLDEPLSGVHSIRIVAHADVDGDGEFDAETDRPCRNDGDVVQTGVERLDFTELEGTSTPNSLDQ